MDLRPWRPVWDLNVLLSSRAAQTVSPCSCEYILSIDKDYIKVTEGKNLKIEILKHDKIVDSLINNMINLLTELQNDYKENIDIRRC